MKADVKAARKAASQLAAVQPCLLCGKRGTCVPAHFPKHVGMGGSSDPAWYAPDKWVPLCGEPGACHDLVDGRLGTASPEGHNAWARAVNAVAAKKAAWVSLCGHVGLT